jgi:hypothetical protein
MKREKITGTVIPTDLLKLTTDQALDRLNRKYYGTRFRRWVTHLRLREIGPRQIVVTILDWAHTKLFPAKAIRKAEILRQAEIARQVELIRQADVREATKREREQEYERELEAWQENWREIAPLNSHIPTKLIVPSPRKKILRKPLKKSKTKKK